MPRGGKREGAGRRKEVKPQEVSGPLAAKRNLCQEVIDALNDPNFKHCPPDSKTKCLKCLIVEDCRELGSNGHAQRRWVTEMAQGKAVHHVNHMHDKPLEVNATLTLGEGMKLAMQKAEERLGNRKRS